MRIRNTKPEFWRSNTIAALSWDARLVLKAVEAYVDDNGVGKDDMVLFASDAFPRDVYQKPSETYLRLEEALTELISHGLVIRYEFDGENLLYVDRFKDKVYLNKPSQGRFPRPDGTLQYAEDVDRSSYQKKEEDSLPLPSSRAHVQAVRQLVSNQIEGQPLAPLAASPPRPPKVTDLDKDPDFAAFWSAYPRKVSKGAAKKSWLAMLRKKTDPALVIAAARTFAEQTRDTEQQYIPHPGTWLSNERWLDQKAEAQPYPESWMDIRA